MAFKLHLQFRHKWFWCSANLWMSSIGRWVYLETSSIDIPSFNIFLAVRYIPLITPSLIPSSRPSSWLLVWSLFISIANVIYSRLVSSCFFTRITSWLISVANWPSAACSVVEIRFDDSKQHFARGNKFLRSLRILKLLRFLEWANNAGVYRLIRRTWAALVTWETWVTCNNQRYFYSVNQLLHHFLSVFYQKENRKARCSLCDLV